MSDSESVQSYAQSAEWYDRIYAGMGKNYAAEVDVLEGIIRAHRPSANSVLDVGCGTGLHLEQLAKYFETVAGCDLAPEFVRCAKLRCPSAAITVADMCSDFDLGRRFDVVVSLFAAIGHVGSSERLQIAISNMSRHLNPGGLLIVEPWIAANVNRHGQYGTEISEAPGSTLIRAHSSRAAGSTTITDFAWTEVTPRGVTRLDEQLRITSFTQNEFQAAFASAGLTAAFDSQGLSGDGRGLWIAQ